MNKSMAARTAFICFAFLSVVPTPAGAGTVIDLSETSVPTVLGGSPGDRLGQGLAGGDLDGDGLTELAVAAPGRDSHDGRPDVGVVYILDADVVSSLGRAAPAESVASISILGAHARERVGETLLVSDLNGDGSHDLVVGAPSSGEDDLMYSGRLYVFLGPLAPGAHLRCEDADVVIRGARAGDRLGSSLAVADVDGDGANELLVSAFRAADASGVRAGSVYILRANSFSSDRRVRAVTELAVSEFRGERDGDGLRGIAVQRTVGDAPPTLALGACHADGPGNSSVDAGRIYLVRGDEVGFLPLRSAVEMGAPMVFGPHPRAFLGRSISCGDIDGDGVDDIAVSAYASRLKKRKPDASGEVFIIFGADASPPNILDLATAEVPRFTSAARWDLFGLPVLVRDLNVDGAADLIVASQFADSNDGERQRCGKVHLFRGGLRSVVEAKAGKADLADVTIVGAQAFDAIGSALSIAQVTGEDADLVVGASDAPDEEGGAAAGKIHIIPSRLLSAR